MSFTTAWNLHGSSSASASDADSQCAGVAWPLVAPGGTFMILTSKRTVAWLVAWRTSACATLENCIDEISVIKYHIYNFDWCILYDCKDVAYNLSTSCICFHNETLYSKAILFLLNHNGISEFASASTEKYDNYSKFEVRWHYIPRTYCTT